ncbi:tetratricopeptide repeat protein [Phytohabitans flavus]|uniref:tetratricopeptide repeat protein n=1 Tax=Phytohabitans flavus TaxID=1076124 RepID=UPI0036367DC2
MAGEAGDAAGAAEALDEVLADRLRVLGPDHPDTLTTRNSLAYWRGKRGTRPAPSRRSRRCSPTSCGCSARTTPTR